MHYVIPIYGIFIDNQWWYIKNFVSKTCILRESDFENCISIRKHNNSDSADGFHMVGMVSTVLISEIFGVSSGIPIDSFNIMLESRAGEHNIRINEGHEEL